MILKSEQIIKEIRKWKFEKHIFHYFNIRNFETPKYRSFYIKFGRIKFPYRIASYFIFEFTAFCASNPSEQVGKI